MDFESWWSDFETAPVWVPWPHWEKGKEQFQVTPWMIGRDLLSQLGLGGLWLCFVIVVCLFPFLYVDGILLLPPGRTFNSAVL